MFLVKCKCGCFFTVKEEALRRHNLSCQNCDMGIPLLEHYTISELQEAISRAGSSLQWIPNDSEITVKFNT